MLRFVFALLVGAAVAVPRDVSAGSKEVLMPISVGAIGNRDVRAATIGFGCGPYEDRLHFLFHARAIVAPHLSAGVGGVRGGYAFVERKHVHFGIDLGASAGGGVRQRRGLGLIAAVESGLFVRLVSETIGAVHFDAGWFQPFVVRKDGLGGAAMLSIAWSPFFGR